MSKQDIQSVLYVDDDPDICEVVQATLCLIAGLDVHTAGSGAQAIDLACELRPDLILMDVMMPGLDGPSTLERIRAHALLAHIPVIFLTAKVLPAEVSRLLKLGALGVIGKPFDPMKLCDDLFAIWNQAHVGRGNAASSGGESQVQAEVNSLTVGFLERTGNDIIRLRAIVELAGHEGPEVLEEAKRLAHSIHGAGAMFGFAKISVTGGAMEYLIESVMSNIAAPNSVLGPDVQKKLLDLADQLLQNVEACWRAAPASAATFMGDAVAGRIESSVQPGQRMLEVL